MPRQKDVVELELAKVLKSARTSIRLKHSLAADEEINNLLPEIETEFMAAVSKGKKYTLAGIIL